MSVPSFQVYVHVFTCIHIMYMYVYGVFSLLLCHNYLVGVAYLGLGLLVTTSLDQRLTVWRTPHTTAQDNSDRLAPHHIARDNSGRLAPHPTARDNSGRLVPPHIVAKTDSGMEQLYHLTHDIADVSSMIVYHWG